ncbi:hypothetical protein LP52_05545 [Streptomonospora alba]|uniref:Uncharacterized protein n=1 Tax=Streptomonospora alba TaxID=183763 RepID=A0A0C2JSA8_9ACTN|nr:hypothetical protein LP52_05545 [Streptomonospora alba]
MLPPDWYSAVALRPVANMSLKGTSTSPPWAPGAARVTEYIGSSANTASASAADVATAPEAGRLCRMRHIASAPTTSTTVGRRPTTNSATGRSVEVPMRPTPPHAGIADV